MLAYSGPLERIAIPLMATFDDLYSIPELWLLVQAFIQAVLDAEWTLSEYIEYVGDVTLAFDAWQRSDWAIIEPKVV